MPGLEISLFGGFLIRDWAGDSIELPGQKDRALLGYLAVSPDVPYPREKLAALLWGDSGDRQARDSLKQALLRLRRGLAPIAPAALVTSRQTVMLDGTVVAVDVGKFERLLQEGSAEARERAIALYSGDLLDGVVVRDAAFEDWLLVERQRLRDLATEGAAALMVQARAAGRRDLASSAARRLLTLDPLHEAAARVLMQTHADRGERAQALKIFETSRERLQRELGVTPENETVTLYQSIRRHRASGGPPEIVLEPEQSITLPSTAAESQETAPAPDTTAKPSIAVLPFANIGDDPEQDYFADGLTEDIITDLSKVSAIFVAARHRVFTFKGRRVAEQQVARELGVRYILEGSVRNAAGRIRINAQLIDGETGGHLWADRYDRSLDDIFGLQDEIAKSIVDVLKVKLLPEELEGITSHATDNIAAYQYYLMGRSFYLRGMDKHCLRIAREMFAKAAEIDPHYARAYASLAICEAYLSISEPSTGYKNCLTYSARALELDSSLPDAIAARGFALYAAGQYAAATEQFERAIMLGPDLFEAYFFHARNCRLQGLHQKSAELFERAAALRPIDFRSLGLLSEAYQALGQQENFLSAARRCVERLEAEIGTHPDNADALAFGSAVLLDLDEPTRAADWAARALMIGPDDYLVQYNVARSYAMLGRFEPAMDCLEQAFGLSSVFQRRLAFWMESDADLDPLRDLPRFHALLKRLEANFKLSKQPAVTLVAEPGKKKANAARSRPR